MVGYSQVSLSFNQIARFFDQQYHRKEPINIFNFLVGNNYQGKVGSRTTSFGWASCPVRLQDYLIKIMSRGNQLIS